MGRGKGKPSTSMWLQYKVLIFNNMQSHYSMPTVNSLASSFYNKRKFAKFSKDLDALAARTVRGSLRDCFVDSFLR